jgi:hypothetical protein
VQVEDDHVGGGTVPEPRDADVVARGHDADRRSAGGQPLRDPVAHGRVVVDHHRGQLFLRHLASVRR